eukprot:1033902-Rhodomonas_salina.1
MGAGHWMGGTVVDCGIGYSCVGGWHGARLDFEPEKGTLVPPRATCGRTLHRIAHAMHQPEHSVLGFRG